MKAIAESFKRSGILTTSAKVSFQTTSLASQLLKSKNQYKCVAGLIETMESAKYTIKEAVQAIQELDFEENTVLTVTLKKMQNNDISKTMNLQKSSILPTVYRLLQHSRKEVFHDAAKTLAKNRKFNLEKIKE